MIDILCESAADNDVSWHVVLVEMSVIPAGFGRKDGGKRSGGNSAGGSIFCCFFCSTKCMAKANCSKFKLPKEDKQTQACRQGGWVAMAPRNVSGVKKGNVRPLNFVFFKIKNTSFALSKRRNSNFGETNLKNQTFTPVKLRAAACGDWVASLPGMPTLSIDTRIRISNRKILTRMAPDKADDLRLDE
uniref:Uncharacterized protein n=1 Tax=Romanomermis culicivorax TaxID=13658 RepID=A0A915IUI0_ROMCU